MRFEHTACSRRQVGAAPPAIQRTLEKQLRLLVKDLRHPSLRAKKYDETGNVWQARINRGWRFYFQIQNDTYIILSIIPHPK